MKPFDVDALREAHAAIQTVLSPLARAYTTEEQRRGLALALIYTAEGAHRGPWKDYLADVCGLESVPDEWRDAMGPAIQRSWDSHPTQDVA